MKKKLVPSDARMFATNWDERKNVDAISLKLQQKSVRGTISNRQPQDLEKNPLKLNAKIQKPNLQTVDFCTLPAEKDTLKLNFTLKILSGIQVPSACNSPEFLTHYKNAVANYIESMGFFELAMRYATNIANGRFLWRNRVGAEKIEVVVKHINGASWTFDAKSIGLQQFDNPLVKELADIIAKSLKGETEFSLLEICAYSQLGRGQEVYPSEELILDNKNLDNKNDKTKKSKILYDVDGIAGLHSQKIGNAVRTIDTWYSDTAENPIAIETYGSVTTLGIAHRKPKEKNDFYTLFEEFVQNEPLNDTELHYVMAMLVRGGVFGESSKKSK